LTVSAVQSEQTSNRVVAVLGMHSGGTSAITRGLDCLGVDLGDQLLPGGEHQNPRGFFEDEPLLEISDQVLTALGIRWESTRWITRDEWKSPDIDRLRLHAVESIKQRFASVPIWGFKNPRSARLLPFWQSVFSLVGRTDSYVIALRNPLSVAQSLHERNGFSKRRAYLLWLIHQVQSVARTKGKPRVCVDFDLLIENPDTQLGRMATSLDLTPPSKDSLEAYTSNFLSRELRHSRFSDEDVRIEPELSALGQRAYEILHRWASDDDVASVKIDRAMRQIEKRLLEISPILSELDVLEAQVHQERYVHTSAAGEWREERRLLIEAAETQSQGEIALRDEITRTIETLEVSNAGLNAQQSALASAEKRASTLASSVAELERSRQSLEETTIDLDREQLRLLEIVERLEGRLRTEEQDAEALDQKTRGEQRKSHEALQESLDKLARVERHHENILIELDEIRSLRSTDVERLAAQVDLESARARSLDERNQKLSAELDQEREHRIEISVDSNDAYLRDSMAWVVDRVTVVAANVREHAEAASRTRTWRLARRLQQLIDRLRWRSHHDGLQHVIHLAQLLQTRSTAATSDVRDLASQAEELSRTVRKVLQGEILIGLRISARIARRILCLRVVSGPADQLLDETIEIAHFLTQLRESPFLRTESGGETGAQHNDVSEQQATVDVIVPVYGAYTETQRCIESLLRSGNSVQCEIIVVDDGNHDSKLLELLGSHAQRGQITLLRSPENMGFPNAVNLGMALHPDRDVVLLNSDTRVSDHWLDRLRHAARSDWRIATVTPFSNDGQICSWPQRDSPAPAPNDQELNRLNSLITRENHGSTLTIPTAIGFCMYITREALREVGLFDVDCFGRGYGEESDFSMRARAKGYRNVLAADVYVAHEGNRSFGLEREERTQHAARAISLRHPTYEADIARFIQADPVRPFRRLLETHTSSGLGGPNILMIGHNRGGGTQNHIMELSRSLENEGVGTLFLQPTAEGSVQLSGKIGVSSFSSDMIFDLDFESEMLSLSETLCAMNVRHIHIHHILDSPFSVTTLPGLMGISFDVTLHDYFEICPRIHLADGSNQYCGEPDSEDCNRCVERLGSELGRTVDVALWRERNRNWLTSARRIFVPSVDTAKRFSRYFPDLDISVRPHPSLPFAPSKRRRKVTTGRIRRVAVIGAIDSIKGSEILLSTIRDADQRKLPIQFEIIGYTDRDSEIEKLHNATISGPYHREDLPSLLERSDCEFAFFPTSIPETYSYTLSEAVSAGLFPVAFAIGAPADRIRESKWGHPLPLDLEASEINDALLTLEMPERHGRDSQYGQYESILTDYYGALELNKPASSD
jgi:GT2 family glycosyltransferase/glycosyltransferase involved in cell wall biosynthesis